MLKTVNLEDSSSNAQLAAAQELVRLAPMPAAADQEADRVIRDRGISLVTALLAAGDDNTLRQACALLQTQPAGESAANALRSLIREQAETYRQENGAISGVIAVPVYGPSLARTGPITVKNSTLASLARLLQSTELIETAATIRFQPRLVSATELLNWTWSQVYALAQGRSMEPAPPEKPVSDSLKITRFLIATVTAPPEILAPFRIPMGRGCLAHLETDVGMLAALATWLGDGSKLLTKALQLDNDMVFVDAPGKFFSALTYGTLASGLMSLKIARAYLAAEKLNASDLQIVVSRHDRHSGRREVRLVLETIKGTLPKSATTVDWPPVELCNDALILAEMTDVIQKTVGNVVSIQNTETNPNFGNELCSCGEPRLFLSNRLQFCPECNMKAMSKPKRDLKFTMH